MEIHDLNPRRYLEYETKVKGNHLGLPEYDGDVPVHDKRMFETDRGHVMINVKEAKLMNDMSVRTNKIYILDKENPYNIDINDIDAFEKGTNLGAKLDQDYKTGVQQAISEARKKVSEAKKRELAKKKAKEEKQETPKKQ